MDKDQGKSVAPPYVAYRTLSTFLDRFKQGVPNRIGTELMKSMSGGTRSQLLTSLKSFGLIDDSGGPQTQMKRLCSAEGAERQKVLSELVHTTYPYLFNDHFNFATTTLSLLREAIQEHTVANGETVNRCIGFLKEAAADAGITVSPFLKEHKPRAARPTGARRSRTQEEAKAPGAAAQTDGAAPRLPALDLGNAPAAQSSLLLWGLFQRLPKPGTAWPRYERDQWTQTLQNVLALEYPEQPA